MKTVPVLALTLALGCQDYTRVEGEPPGEEEEVPAIVPPRDDAEAFDPALDTDRDGALDPEEGLGDADGDGVRDRDEAYEPAG